MTVEGSGAHISSTQRLIQRTVTPKEPQRASHEKRPGPGITLTTTPARTLNHSEARHQGADRANISITGYTHPGVHIISEEVVSRVTAEGELKESLTSIANRHFMDGLSSGVDSPKVPVQNDVFTSMTNENPSGPGSPCVLGLRPCSVLPTFNGTVLLWEDMRRTLAFAWELHVFGSASLFILMAVLAVVGMAGACTLPHPVCDALILANGLLILSGTLRGVLFVVDPYGTRQILSRAILAALHNIPLQLLLWAQITLALVTLRGLNLFFYPVKLQHPWVVGGLAMSHCIPLLVADLCSPTLSHSLPLLLHTLSLCWGLPFCMGILPKSFSHLHPFLRSSLPQWVPSQRIEKRAKRVIAVCAFLGALCCSLQMYSLLWLYGLLGNWRRFGWGWWLSQFWARILELAWGFSLLILGSWIFWMPSLGHSRGDHGQGRSDVSKVVEKNLWGRILASLQRGPLRKSEKSWEDLMPSNWAKYNLSKTGFINKAMCPYDDHTSSGVTECKPDPVSTSTTDSQTTLLWQQVGERECVLSLIEFDMRPPSPINLRRSIDNALHHGQLVAGGLFTPPPPSWTHSFGTDTTDGDGGTTALSPAYVRFGWMLDTESISASLDHFQAKEPIQSPVSTSDYNGSDGSPAAAHLGEEFNSAFSAVMHQHDWSDDDITDL